MTLTIERIAPRESTCQVPEPLPGEPGLVQVDATWGEIQPMQAAARVRTVGELDVMAHLEKDLPLVDGRTHDYHVVSTIPRAKNIPHTEAAARMDELNQDQPTIFFCNGPQCGQSPMAIRALLEAGYPTDKILYYRGGLHDWLTLGLPVMAGE
ncbi:MAG: rhodanese-like domain-containing protein [Anaerolineales bacterium]|nr:rhodanese-like domain-containing protein [Anaerolineales bacterium]